MLEPMTAMTDFLLAAVAIVLGVKLTLPYVDKETLCRYLWGNALIFIGLSAFLGGLNHGFVSPLNSGIKLGLWKFTMACIGTSILAFMSSMLCGSNLPVRFVRHCSLVLGSLNLAYLASLWLSYDFRVVVTWALLGLAALVIFCFRTRTGRTWMICGTILTGVGGWLWSNLVGLNSYINHNDLYHLLQLAAVVMFYKAGKNLEDVLAH